MPSASGIRAGAAYIELFVKDSRLVKGLNAAGQKLQAFGAGLTAAGQKLLGIGTVLATPFLGAAKLFADTGGELLAMSRRTGASVEALSELAFAAGKSGADTEALEGSLRKMQQVTVDAAKGSQEAQMSLARLGLTVADLAKLAPDQQFTLIADRLSMIRNPALRASLAMSVLGDSGAKLLPLLSGGAKGIEELRGQARALGMTVSTEDATAAAALGRSMDLVWQSVKSGVAAIGSALAPLLTDVAGRIAEVVRNVRDWIRQNAGVVTTIFQLVAGFAAAGAALVVLGAAASGLGTVLTIVAAGFGAVATLVGFLGTVLAALLSPIGLVIAGVAALAAFVLHATGAGADALAWLGDKFAALRDTATAAWKGIGDALAAGDIGLAAKILWLTLKMEFQRGVNWLEEKWLAFKGFFIDVFQGAVFGLARFLTDAWAGLQVAWVETVNFLANAWTNFTSSIQKGWNNSQNIIEKGWAHILGLFDKDFDTQDVLRQIDQDTQRQNARVEQERQSVIAGREQERQKRRGEIEQERVDTRKGLDQQQAADQAQREARNQAALKQSAEELAGAKKEWQGALDEAARKRAEVEAEAAAGKEPGRAGLPALPTAPELANKAQADLHGFDQLVDTTQRKIEVAGTFNAAAIRGLGAHSLAERTAQAAEQVAANTRKLLAEAQQGGLVFK